MRVGDGHPRFKWVNSELGLGSINRADTRASLPKTTT
jgi:hypothetical protein